MMVCLFGDRGHFWKRLRVYPPTPPQPLFPLRRLSRCLGSQHGSLLPVRGRAAVRMELSVRRLLRHAQNGRSPREAKAGFYALGG